MRLAVGFTFLARSNGDRNVDLSYRHTHQKGLAVLSALTINAGVTESFMRYFIRLACSPITYSDIFQYRKYS